MGVVTDVTVKGLTTAVTNISNTGMSDTTGQAINSTLSTLGKDTSLQDIKAALNALAGVIGPSVSQTTTGANGALVRKYGNVVTIHLDEVFGSNLGTIPEAYRPTTSICAFLYIEKLSSGSISNRYYGMIRANTDGSFGGGYIMNYSANSFTSFKDANHKLYGTITYIV